MTYSRTIAPGNRLGIVAGVGALHIAALYAVASGLTVAFIPFADPPPISATNTPLPKPTPPKPDRHRERQVLTDPHPQPSQTAETIFKLDPTFDGTSGGGGGERTQIVDPPLPPIRPPQPLFTPKAARPLGQPGLWVSERDYPTSELRLDHSGAVGFTLAIGASGQVTGCTVTRSSGFPVLDEATCRLIARRARFEPARDDQGLPVPGQFASTVRWQIPD